MKVWNNEALVGHWIITAKVDGVNATWDGERFVSRRGKPLNNVNHVGASIGAKDGEVYEIFCGSFKDTISVVRSHDSPEHSVIDGMLFDLEPEIDPRLVVVTIKDPTTKEIKALFDGVRAKGYEGLVLRGPNGERLKVKEKLTLDLIVLGVTEGKGRNAGRTGALITSRGKVSGMTDQERNDFYGGDIVGKLIEVECMELTEKGNMRHARFIKVRDDKPVEENDDK